MEREREPKVLRGPPELLCPSVVRARGPSETFLESKKEKCVMKEEEVELLQGASARTQPFDFGEEGQGGGEEEEVEEVTCYLQFPSFRVTLAKTNKLGFGSKARKH